LFYNENLSQIILNKLNTENGSRNLKIIKNGIRNTAELQSQQIQHNYIVGIFLKTSIGFTIKLHNRSGTYADREFLQRNRKVPIYKHIFYILCINGVCRGPTGVCQMKKITWLR